MLSGNAALPCFPVCPLCSLAGTLPPWWWSGPSPPCSGLTVHSLRIPRKTSRPFLKKHFQQKPRHWFQLVQVGHKPVYKPITAPRTHDLIAHIPIRTSSLKHMGGGMWIVHEMRGLQWVGLDLLKRGQLLLKEVSCASKTSDHFAASKGSPASKLYHS